jgi:hypothetical protein
MVRQEMKSGQMIFTDWNECILEFMATSFPENKEVAALM